MKLSVYITTFYIFCIAPACNNTTSQHQPAKPIVANKTTPASPKLTNEKLLKTLVENRTVYNLENCELNLLETYQQSELVPLKFNDLVFTSMLKENQAVKA